jgi:hypothetical protein
MRRVGGEVVVTHRNGPAGEAPGGERDRDRRVGATLRDPNRLHVTLDNLNDLADFTPPALNQGDVDRFWGEDSVSDLAMVDGSASPRPGWARPAERWLLELLAMAAASLAFVSPSVVLLVLMVVCVVGGVAAFVASGNPVRSLPRRVVVRSLTLLHPRSSLWAPAMASRVVLGAVVLAGGVATAIWMADEGSDGVAAAARAGAWTDGFRVAAALVGAMLLTSVGDGRARRARTVRRWAGPATDGTLVILAISCVAATALIVLAVPHLSDPIASRADGLGWLPSGARDYADTVRDDIVTNELNALASCLSARTDTGWVPSYTSENDAGDPDVAKLTAVRSSSSVGAPGDLATVVLAAHNQLAPWVEVIEVHWSTGEKVRTERANLPNRRPVTDATLLAAETAVGSVWLTQDPPNVTQNPPNVPTILDCSVGPVL